VEWRSEEGGGASGPEIDAREKSINVLQTMRVQTRTLQREDLGNVESDKVLIPPVSMRVVGPRPVESGQTSKSYVDFLAPQCAEGLFRCRKAKRRVHRFSSCPRERTSAQTTGALMPG
jgi:hypothetical protein